MLLPSTARWRAVVLLAGLAVLVPLAGCSGDDASSEPSTTMAAPLAATSEAADAAAPTGPTLGPLRIDVVFDDGVESLSATIEADPAARAGDAGATLPDAATWCSGESFVPGETYAVKIDHSRLASDAGPSGQLQWVEVESSAPVDGPGTYPAEVFVLLAGDTALELEGAELTVGEDLRSGSFSGVSAAGVRVEATFTCG